MKRSLLASLMIVTAGVILAVAFLGFRAMNGGPADTAFAGSITVSLDMDAGPNGSQPCVDIDASAPHALGDTYYVAICVTGLPGSVGVATFDVLYDDTLNTAPEVENAGKGLDDNPDGNAGSTFWGDEGFGAAFDCSGGGSAYPMGDRNIAESGPGKGDAFISCMDVTVGPWGLGDDETSGVIAVIKFVANKAGTDNLIIKPGLLGDTTSSEMGSCNPSFDYPMTCVGGEDIKVAPPPQCDIEDTEISVDKPALSMKIGEHDFLTLTETVTNLGAVIEGVDPAVCAVNVALLASNTLGNVFDPTKLGVRINGEGSANPLTSDICYTGDATGGSATYGVEWIGWPCNEGDAPGPHVLGPAPTGDTGTCQNAFDDDEDGICDWDGYSASCVPAASGPDLDTCLDTSSLLVAPLSPAVLIKDATATVSREVKIECRSVGNYVVILAAGFGVTGVVPPEGYDPNLANNESIVAVPVFCAGLESAMVKDCAPDETGVQSSCNLWLMDPDFGGKQTPEVLPAADDNGCVIANEGKGCLAVDVLIANANDIDDLNDSDGDAECLGAWEHQVRFDHKILSIVSDLTPGDPSWLESTGRVADCTINVLNEDSILEGCVTTGTGNGPCGDGLLEQMLIIPKTEDLIYRSVFRPTKDNGVLTNIVDDNCEITDIYGEAMTGTLPGQLVPVCGDLYITVRMLECDVDLDCDVDVADEQAVAMRYGASWGLQLYNQWFDLEPKYADQDIDIKDLQFCFGRNLSTCQAPIPDDQADPVAPPQSFP